MTKNTPPPASPDLPQFVCLVSFEERVLAYGRAATEDDAHAWCKRARSLFLDHGEQVVIANPVEVDWEGVGRVLTLSFWAGWTRTGSSWQTADRALCRLHFDELPRGPTPLAELRPPSTAPGALVRNEELEMRSVARLLVHLAHGTRALAQAAQAVTRKRGRVLIVNENSKERRSIRDALAKRLEITEAESFSGALLELAYYDFDAVVANQAMGAVGSGLHLLEEVRDRWPRARRVLCATSAHEIEAAVASGAAQHVVKVPLDADTLMAMLAATPREAPHAHR
jgi:ActR/RegA family two-component response regulator